MTFQRDATTGELTFLEAFETRSPFHTNDQTFVVSPGGDRLFVSLRSMLLSFRRAVA